MTKRDSKDENIRREEFAHGESQSGSSDAHTVEETTAIGSVVEGMFGRKDTSKPEEEMERERAAVEDES